MSPYFQELKRDFRKRKLLVLISFFLTLLLTIFFLNLSPDLNIIGSWKTYSSDLGFLFEYPDNLIAAKIPIYPKTWPQYEKEKMYWNYITLASTNINNQKRITDKENVLCTNYKESISPENDLSILKGFFVTIKNSLLEANQQKAYQQIGKRVEVNGKTAYKLEKFTRCNLWWGREVQVFIKREGNEFVVLEAHYPLGLNNYSLALDRMISSLKLTSQSKLSEK